MKSKNQRHQCSLSEGTHTSLLDFVAREIKLTWLFIYRDISATILPGTVLVLVSWWNNNAKWNVLPVYILHMMLHMGLSIYTFCLSNQVVAIEEDRANKPNRPLPAGLITVKEVYIRLVISNILYLSVGYCLGLIWYTVAWQLITFLLNNMNWGKHWISKNLLGMTGGALVLFSAQWQIVQPLSKEVWIYMTAYSVWVGIAILIQDLRDQDGDRLHGRRTLPLAIGDASARTLLSIHFIILSPLIFIGAAYLGLFSKPERWVLLIIEVLFSWLIAYRTWMYRTPEDDHKTYMWFTYLADFNLLFVAFI
jgi:4-hydroxybenzoate polyprenyltransferase